MDGLVAKGSDYAVPNTVAAKTLAIDGLTEGDAVNLYVYPSRQADVTVSWTDDQGLKKTNQQTLESNRVSVIDLGSVPSRDRTYHQRQRAGIRRREDHQ